MRRETQFWIRSLALASLVALLLAACEQPTHEERVAQIRSKYEATLNGFVVEQEPVEPAPAEAEGTETSEDEAMVAEMADEQSTREGAAEEGEMGEAAEEAVPVRQDVLLDILVRHDSAEKLPGVTVDITMADGERELETWRVWFDTSDLEKGPGVQYTHTLEDVEYEPGYGFSAEIRHPVPPGERSLYQEFTPAAP